MKKLFVVFFLLSLAFVISAQGPFRTVTRFATAGEQSKLLRAGVDTVFQTSKWAWRFDATMLVAEVTRNKVTKEWATTSFSAIGPAIGLQKFVPKSDIDPTPVNVYGLAVGIALGQSIYNPELAQAKVVLAANLWEYFRFGLTYTLQPSPDIAKLGLFFGGGITF